MIIIRVSEERIIQKYAHACVDNWTTTVKILQVKSKTWYKVANMPGPPPSPSAATCGDRLHVIGSDTNGYSCSLQEILQRCQPISQPPLHSVSRTSIWRALPTPPQKDSTAATLCGELIIIGGGDEESSLHCIYQLAGQKWVDVIGILATGRRRCLVANGSPEKIFIVGGIPEQSVEE